MEEIKHNLVGDIKSDLSDADAIQDFFIELEMLMMRYKIDKLSVAWRKFTPINK